MDCSRIRGLLLDFLEGDLSLAEAQAVRDHVLHCDSCRRELLGQKKSLACPRPSLSPRTSDDWPDVVGRKLEKGGPWSSLLGSFLLPWEKKIPLLIGTVVLLLVIALSLRQTSCGVKKTEPSPPLPSPTAISRPTPLPAEENVRLRKSPAGSVLILEEPSGKTAPAVASAGTEEGKAPPPPGGDYDPFQDQQVKLYVADVPGGLEQAVQVALSSGGQLINFPIKGFENMGPHERTLVFDIRTYRPFLKRLEGLGKLEHPPIARSDYVTVRLTVLPLGATAPVAPPAGK